MNKRGVALIFCYIIILVLAILGATLLMRSISESHIAQIYLNQEKAFWLADAGIEQSIWELNKNKCLGCVQCVSLTPCADCNCAGANKCISATLGASGDFDALITSNAITSTGSVPNRNTSNRTTRRITVSIGIKPDFTYAAFGKNQVILLNNAKTDSFNSSSGLYGGSNIGANGDIGTNSSSSTAITLGNNAVAHGDASTGPGGTVQLSNNAQVTGSISHSNNVNLPSVIVPTILKNLSSSGAININNNGSQTISSGSYKYSSITIQNNGTLTINGAVTLYLTNSASDALNTMNNDAIVISAGSSLKIFTDGPIKIKNNSQLNNVTKVPANFGVYSTYTGANGIDIANNGDFFGTVYAPDTDILLANNIDTFGAFVGKTVDLSNNGDIHYDEALGQVPGISDQYAMSNWQEQ